MQKIRNLFKHEEGFTLIELLVVIAVLGILAAIAIPRLGGVTDKARMAEASSAMGSIKTSLEMYNVENNGVYPTSQGGGGSTDFDVVMGNYIDSYDTANSQYGGNLTWDVNYIPDYNGSTAGDDEFRIEMTVNGEEYLVTMNHSSSGYTDVTTGLSN